MIVQSKYHIMRSSTIRSVTRGASQELCTKFHIQIQTPIIHPDAPLFHPDSVAILPDENAGDHVWAEGRQYYYY